MSHGISKYAYAVSSAHVYEKYFFSRNEIDKLLSVPSYDAVIYALREKGWDIPEDIKNIEKITELEMNRMWNLIKETVPDKSLFECLVLSNDFHNLKAGIKCFLSKRDTNMYFVTPSLIPEDLLQNAIENGEYESLPELYGTLGKEISGMLEKTGDGMTADVLIDKMCLDTMAKTAASSGVQMLKDIMGFLVASTNIKIVYRAIKTGRDKVFCEKALSTAECSLDREKLIEMSEKSVEEFLAYLAETPYAEGGKLLSDSPADYEKWVDDRITGMVLPVKNSPLGPEPVIGFFIGKSVEVKNIRVILSAKLNNLPIEALTTRLRRVYE